MKFSFTSRKRSGGWMAITLHRDRVDLAQVSRGAGGRPEVRSLDSYRKEKSDADALAILRKEHSLGGGRCITALGPGEYQILQLDAPDVPREEMKEAVRWRIKDMIDFPPEAATIDVVDVPSNQAAPSRARGLHVFCARSEVIGARMALFDAAKIALRVIDVPEMSLRNMAALWAKPRQAIALLSFDEVGATLVIVAEGELYTTRHIDIAEADLADRDEGRRRSHWDRIALELQRSFDYYDRQFGALPLERLIVAAPRTEGLIEHFASVLYVPVEIADLAAVMDFPAVPELRDPGRQAMSLVTLGLALRSEEAA